MAKTAGFPAKIQITDVSSALRDLSNDITDFTVNTPRGEQNVTGLDKSALERIALLADAKFSLKGVFNAAANKSHAVLTGLINAGTSSLCDIDLPPATMGAPRLPLTLLWTDLTYSRSASGEMTWSATADLADGTVPTWTTVP